MPEALTQVQRDAVVSQATAIAAQQGITPEQALYNYAQQNGLSASDVDAYMGFPAGSTQNWAVQNGKVAAPQGNGPYPLVSFGTGGYDPWAKPAPQGNSYTAPTQTSANLGMGGLPAALDPTQRASVVQQAQDISAKYGISPEMALCSFGTGGYDPAGIDSYMGFAPGTSSDWAAKNGVGGAPSKNLGMGGAPSKNLGMGGLPAALDPAKRASVVQQAQDIAKQQGITPEQALYNYAQQNGLSASDVDAYMGFPAGSTQNWAVQNGKVAAPQGNYNPGQAQSAPASIGQYNHGAQLTPAEIAQAKTWSEGRTGSEIMAQAKVLGLTPEQLGSIYGATGQAVQHDFGYGTQSGYNGTGSTYIYSNGAWAAPKPSAPQQSAPAPTPTAPTPPSSPAYQMPVLNALYQAQQQRMTAPVPQFNFQSKGPLSAGVPQQAPVAEAPAGALTTAINGS